MSLVEILYKLRENEDNKSELSLNLLSLLEDNTDVKEMLVHRLISQIVLKNESFAKVVDSKFFTFRCVVYSSGKRKKVALGFSYLQDYLDFSDNLDKDVLAILEEVVKENNLDLLINDISVNGEQRCW